MFGAASEHTERVRTLKRRAWLFGGAATVIARISTPDSVIDLSDQLGWIGYLAPVTFGLLAAFTFFRGKQYEALATKDAQVALDRPPVVYLPPFEHDTSMVPLVLRSLVWPDRESAMTQTAS